MGAFTVVHGFIWTVQIKDWKLLGSMTWTLVSNTFVFLLGSARAGVFRLPKWVNSYGPTFGPRKVWTSPNLIIKLTHCTWLPA